MKSTRNEPYTPFPMNGSWYFEDAYGRTHGPYTTEQQCVFRADSAKEVYDDG